MERKERQNEGALRAASMGGVRGQGARAAWAGGRYGWVACVGEVRDEVAGEIFVIT